MASDIPTISITHDGLKEMVDSESDLDEDFKDAHTDIEDFDSNKEDRNHLNGMKNIQKAMRRNSSSAITDIEDYNDSDSEDELKSSMFPECQISLQEYLDPGFTEEEYQLSKGIKIRSATKIIPSEFTNTLRVELDDPGCLTDCENIDTSDDEGKEYANLISNNNQDDNLPLNETLKFMEHASKETIKEINSVVNDEQDDMNDKRGACCLSNDLSDAEELTMSEDDIEIMNEGKVHLMCNNHPIIDITFNSEEQNIRKGRKLSNRSCSSYLDISENIEDPLTDVEKLGSEIDSDDNDSDISYDGPIIPRARVSVSSITDVEEMDISNACDLFGESTSKEVSDQNLPEPIREIMILKEDDCGDPITKIMPLTESIQHLSIDPFPMDLNLTDVEEISDIDEEYYQLVSSPNVEMPIIDNAVVKNCENIKITHQKKNDFADKEPVTETEEFFVAGTVRRKKVKTKTLPKQKSKYLEVTPQNVEQVVTDVEEIEVSDFEVNTKNTVGSTQNKTNTSRITTPEQETDLEYVTGEEDYCLSETEPEQKSEGFTSNQGNYFSSVSTIEGLIRLGDKIDRKPSPVARGRIFDSEPSSLCPTDIEDIQLPSDVEENLLNASYSRAETVSPMEIQDVLNGSVSVVHEKCSSVFNIDKERNFIKGMKDYSETHTDVEYLDEEVLEIGEEKNKCKAGEEAPTEPKSDDKKK